MTDLQDGAWGIPGWTAQNFAYPPEPGPVPPPGITLVRVHGAYVDDENRTMTGMVRATPSVALITSSTGVQVFVPTEVHEIRRGVVDFKIPVDSRISWTIRQRVGPVTQEVTLTPVTDIDLNDLFTSDAAMVLDGGAP